MCGPLLWGVLGGARLLPHLVWQTGACQPHLPRGSFAWRACIVRDALSCSLASLAPLPPPRAPRPGALVCPSTPGFRERCRPPPSGSRAFGGASREPERRSATGSAVSSRGRCSERSRAQECRPRDVSVPSTTIEALTHAQFHTKRDTFGSALGCGHRRARLAHAAQSRLRSRQMLQTQLRALRPGAGLLRARPAFLGVLGTSVTLSKGAVKPVLLEGAWWERELSSSGVPSASEWGATLV